MIADDHAIVRRGLIDIVSHESDVSVTLECTNGDQVSSALRSENWDLAVLDIAMPGRNILDLIKQAKQYAPNKAVLVLSMYPEEEYAMRMLKSGADGYLSKESAPELLVIAIRRLAAGSKYISPELAENLLHDRTDQAREAHEQLSDREYQVMLAIARGLRLVDIASQMSLSVKTIGTYRTRILSKMQLQSNSDIVRYVLERRLGNFNK